MSYAELVHYIKKNFASHFLVPLSQKYKVSFWNSAMKEAFIQMGLVEK